MTFGDEEEHYSRQFNCGWGLRPENAADVARRIQCLCRALAEAQPDHRDIWPFFAARAIKPDRDPGPILALPQEDLALLIDRKARFDPPRLPAPVGPHGYKIVISARLSPNHPRSIGVSVSAGVYRQGPNDNHVEVEYHVENPIWQDLPSALRIVEAMVDSFCPEWVCANAFIQPPDDDGEGHRRPWIGWRMPGAEIPSYWIEHGGAPAEVRDAFGGELHLWP